MQIPLKEGIGGEREGEFTDNFIIQFVFVLNFWVSSFPTFLYTYKIYVAAMETLMKKERGDETQFIGVGPFG